MFSNRHKVLAWGKLPFFARAATYPALLVTLAMTSIPHFHSKVEFRNGKDDLSRFRYVLVDGSCSSLYVYSVLSGI